MSCKEVNINGEIYVKKGEQPVVMTFEGANPLPNAYAGRFVIVRSRNEGINAGTLRAADETGCILENCRRLWRHRPAKQSVSWYEGVAISGLSTDYTRVSCTVPVKVIVEDYSLTLCTDHAEKSIMEFTPNAQNS
jgi:hypothetical protein